jgi:hypothetical protein
MVDSTMTTATMALTELAEKGADIDVLHQMVGAVHGPATDGA